MKSRLLSFAKLSTLLPVFLCGAGFIILPGQQGCNPSPEVTITAPGDGEVVEGIEVLIEGVAEDNQSVETLMWSIDNGTFYFLDIASSSTVTFSEDIGVESQGQHVLTVRASDSNGAEAETQAQFMTMEPNNDSTQAFEVELPFSGPSSTVYDGDWDWLEFNLVDASEVHVDLLNGSGNWPNEVYVELYNTNGQYVTSIYDDRSLYLGSGQYQALIYSWSYYPIAYQANISATIVEEESYEPNNSQDEAAPIEIDFADANLLLPMGDVDWYTFSLSEVTSIVLETWSDGVELEVELSDAQGNTFWVSYGSNIQMYVSLDAGTYYCRVLSYYYWYDDNAAYSLSILNSGIEDDVFEPNDSLVTASPIELPFSNSDLILVVGNSDYYQFEVTDAAYVMVDAEMDSDFWAYVSLLTEDGNYIVDAWVESNYVEIGAYLEPGSYFISVQPDYYYSDVVRAGYSLQVYINSDIVDDSYEPNDDIDQASSIALDFAEDLELFDSDADWFSFSLSEAQVVTIDPSADFTNVYANLYVSIYNSSKQQIASTYSYSSSPVLAKSLDAGSYYLEILGYVYSYDRSHGDYLDYHLTVVAEDVPDDDAFEPNDGFSTATYVTLPYDSPELILTLGDQDWFEFTVSSTSDVFIDVDARSAGSELRMEWN